MDSENIYALLTAAALLVVKIIDAMKKKKAKNKDSEVGDE